MQGSSGVYLELNLVLSVIAKSIMDGKVIHDMLFCRETNIVRWKSHINPRINTCYAYVILTFPLFYHHISKWKMFDDITGLWYQS